MSHQPSPRCEPASALVEGKLCIWGGFIWGVIISPEKEEPATLVHCFDPILEDWSQKTCGGDVPPRLYDGACASAGPYIYVYGGVYQSEVYGSLYQLDTRSWTWELLSNAGPMRKMASRMIVYNKKLVLFGGRGYSSHNQWAEEIDDAILEDVCLTNELHTFDLDDGENLIPCMRLLAWHED